MVADEERVLDASTAAVASPLLMVWVTRAGIVTPRLDAPPELLHAGGRPEFDEAARNIHLNLAGVQLVEVLGRRSPVSIVAAVDEVVEDLALSRADRDQLDDLARQLVAGGLLRPDADAATSPPEARPSRPDAPTGDESVDLSGPWRSPVPVAFLAGTEGITLVDYLGDAVLRVRPADMVVLSAFVTGCTVDDAFVASGEAARLDRRGFEASVRRLVTADLLRPHSAEPHEKMREALIRKFEAFGESDAAVLSVVEGESQRAASTGLRRPVVVPVDAYEIPMLSLGMVVAYAKAHRDGALQDTVAFAPLWYTKSDRIAVPLSRFGDQPAIFLFSHYTWTAEENLRMSAAVKELVPNAITIHGGPNVPKYEGDVATWFADHPHADIAVHGEGEVTLAELLDVLGGAWTGSGGDAVPDLSVLADVPGMTFRRGDQLVRTDERERIADLDTIPSPYLTGLFGHRKRWQWPSVIFETNRGCPYGCTFCDWGSATLSRIRKFDLERIKAEMEWAAEQGLTVFSMADANYGIFDRDVEIVEWAAELKQRYGAPTEFDVNFAKNRSGNLTRIVQILADAGINTLSVASVQTFDKGVLTTIKRSNLKREKYDALTTEFRQAGFPLYTDVMVGLPGATVGTVRSDLQAVIDRELSARANPTQLLVNSPMNDPAYRAEHGIVAKPGEHLQQTATYSTEDWLEMMAMRRFYYFAERRGILRQIATHVRVDTGRLETEFYDEVRRVGSDPDRWPQLAYLTRVAPDEYVPPGSWAPLMDELRRFCVDELGVADDTALTTVLTVQHALLPVRGRSFPLVLDLDHDYAAWHASVIAAKREHTDGTWHEVVAPLADFGPGTFEIHDSDDCCERIIGQNPQGGITEVIWELDAPSTRPKQPVD